MSFGFSIGDFITVIKLANTIRKEFSSAPSQLKDISNEVRNLSFILQDVEVVLPEQELSSQQKMELHHIAEGSRNVLSDLEKLLDMYGELSLDHGRAGKRVKRVWKRLSWEPEDIKELRGRISSNITLLNAFNSRLTRDNLVNVVRHQQDQECQVIIEWLSSVNYATQQSDFISRRQEGSGQWLLNSNEFQMWINKRKQTLLCLGIPGAGKTIMSSIIIEYLSRRFQNDATIGIAYIYFNFRQQQDQRLEDLVASLLKQLVQEQPSVPNSLKSLYGLHKNKRTRPSFDEVLKVLQSTITSYSTTFIIIDGLDECQLSSGSRRKFISEIFNLQAKTGLNLFVTSRFIPSIIEEFNGSASLEIRASHEDVQNYLDGHMLYLPSFVMRRPDLQEEIKNKIIKAVDGMFLLAQLHLTSLIGKRSPKAIRTALETLSTGSEAYDHAYKEAMERIEGQIADSRELAKQALSWITCSKRTLTTIELRHALAVEIDKLELDEENLPDIEDIISVCAGLVTIDEESTAVRLVHYTTQEYFERTQTFWFPSAHTDIMATCITYLSFNVFATGSCATDEQFKARLQKNVLYDYAAQNWGHHARVALTKKHLVLHFLKCEAKVSASSQAMGALEGNSWYGEEVPMHSTGVHLAAYFGLGEVMIDLLQNGCHLDLKDTYGQTPLLLAAANGHGAVVKLLATMDGIDLNSKDNDGKTPLLRAAANGHDGVVKLLLPIGGVNPNLKDDDGETPLLAAAAKGHEAVVKLLIAMNGIDLNSKDTDGMTPLSWAVANKHEAVAKLLVTTDGIDPNYETLVPMTYISEYQIVV
ncbi:hypothetical protein V491_02414 [Pseudogymnoascus sp. VKM F-3775]|nr:hypothetical protein V491_02414 [Pseudogymnoascus sp. VKM F-3775]